MSALVTSRQDEAMAAPESGRNVVPEAAPESGSNAASELGAKPLPKSGVRRRLPHAGAIGSVLLFLCLSVLASGCFQNETLVRVHANGSGEVEVLSMISAEAAEQAKEMAKLFAEEGQEVEEPDLFPVADLEAAASKMGEGVRFVRSEPVSKDGFVGVRAHYAFDDIRKLTVHMDPDGGGMDGTGGSGSEGFGEDDMADQDSGPDDGITFDLTSSGKGGKLVIHLPDSDFGSEADTVDGEDAEWDDEADSDMDDPMADHEPTDEEIQFIQDLFGGFRFSLAVETDGKITKTNSPYADGNRVTLFDIDFGKLMADMPKFKALAGRGEPSSMAEAAEWLKEFDGIKVHLEDTVEIEFSGK
ncbi:MAG: hypothetical protein R3E97_07545 [Candidatus Eisenbacteria bacterium]